MFVSKKVLWFPTTIYVYGTKPSIYPQIFIYHAKLFKGTLDQPRPDSLNEPSTSFFLQSLPRLLGQCCLDAMPKKGRVNNKWAIKLGLDNNPGLPDMFFFSLWCGGHICGLYVWKIAFRCSRSWALENSECRLFAFCFSKTYGVLVFLDRECWGLQVLTPNVQGRNPIQYTLLHIDKRTNYHIWFIELKIHVQALYTRSS